MFYLDIFMVWNPMNINLIHVIVLLANVLCVKVLVAKILCAIAL